MLSDETKSLIISLILNIDKFEQSRHLKSEKNRSSILVFLPGIHEVEEMAARLSAECSHSRFRPLRSCNSSRLIVRCLHSQISIEEQAQNFRKAEVGWRKVIFATNIAESSITVPDIKYGFGPV